MPHFAGPFRPKYNRHHRPKTVMDGNIKMGKPETSYAGPQENSVSVKATDYNPDEARRLLEGTLEERVVNYAELKYGKGEKVKEALHKGEYRSNAVNPLDVLDRVCSGSGLIDAEFTETSIDTIVQKEQKPSMLKVAVKGTLNLVNKTCWYYPLVGALPAKYQEKVARKLADNSDYYTIYNMVAELVGASALGYSVAGILGVVFGSTISVVHSCWRLNLSTSSKGCTAGNALITLPMYATLYSIVAVKESYTSALQQEQQKLLPPPAKKKREKKEKVYTRGGR